MTYDLKIQGGMVIDGTGSPAVRADVGILGGRIADVGPSLGGAKRTIDAEGALVTPGFVDLHTHYDGQISWDSDLIPSSLHGVTTCVMGNCGVGFAPVRDKDRERLVALMEGVEDIPGSALAEGIDWRWGTFPEYMAGIDARPHAIDFCAQIPHDAVRVFVMGDRAIAGEPATESDVAAMRAVVREAILAGAAGFSTGRSDNHRSSDGKHTPAAEANTNELAGIARAFEGLNHGVIQAVSDFDMDVSPDRFDGEFDVLEKMVEASGRPASISLMQRDAAAGQWRQIIARAEKASARGVTIRLQVAPRAIGVLLGLQATFHPFIGFPSYKAISTLPLEERVKRMADPAFRARLLAETPDKVSGDGSPIPPLADKLLAQIDFVSLRLFRLGERPNYEPELEGCLYNEAYSKKVPVLSALYDAMLENGGKELLYFPLFNYTEMSLDNVGVMLNHPLALPGLSDGGAHVGTVCDAGFPTFMLSHWGRDRRRGKLPVERLVKMMCHDTAEHIGLRDRGRLAPGLKADVNVIELDKLSMSRPYIVSDLPAGGRRLLQDSTGYRATIVSGEVIVENSRLTGARPGRLVRVSG